MDAESGRIQAFLRRKLGLHDPESADSGASDTPLTPEGSGRVIHSAQSVRGMGHLIVVEHADGLQSV